MESFREQLEKLYKETNPRVFGQVLKSKKNSDLWEWVKINNTCDENATIREIVYCVLYNPAKVCKYNMKLKWKQKGDDYGFCGSAKICQCHRDNSAHNANNLNRKQSEETKKKNLLEKYGVENVMQIPEIAKKVHKNRLPISNKAKGNLLATGLTTVLNRVNDTVIPKFTNENYKGSFRKNFYKWECVACHYEFEDHIDYGRTPRCPRCLPKTISKEEIAIANFLSAYTQVVRNDKTIISPQEIDIYLPEFNIAIEYNGDYWHSTIHRKDPKYHIKKYLDCKEKGIHLIQIFEHEWLSKSDIIKNRLLSVINKSSKTYARKTKVQEISNAQANSFCKKYHIQGSASASLAYGIYYNNSLLAVMTFGKSRYCSKVENEYELIRYCSIGNVVGGASKLLKKFEKDIKPSKIISYASRTWSKNGDLYRYLGFTDVTVDKYNTGYFYVKNGVKYHRSNFTKKKLIETNHSERKTENEIMKELGYLKIYDCGNYKFEKKL